MEKMSVSVKYSKISNNKDRQVNHCDVTSTRSTKGNSMRSFGKRVQVTSHCQICLTLLFEFML